MMNGHAVSYNTRSPRYRSLSLHGFNEKTLGYCPKTEKVYRNESAICRDLNTAQIRKSPPIPYRTSSACIRSATNSPVQLSPRFSPSESKSWQSSNPISCCWTPSTSRTLSNSHPSSVVVSANHSFQRPDWNSEEYTSCESDFIPRFAHTPKKIAPSLTLNTLELNKAIERKCNVKIADGVWRGKCDALRSHDKKNLGKCTEELKHEILEDEDNDLKRFSEGEDVEIFANEFREFPDMDYLGVGASARVVKALHCKTAQVIALKRVRSYDQMYQSETEMASMHLLPHNCPQLVKLLAFWRDDRLEENVLALEYLDLGSLRSYIRKNGCLSEKMCRHIARELCYGLVALHDRNLIHRDIKLANILLSTSGAVKICDFGLLYKCRPGEPCRMASGTLKYFSPERLDNSYGPKADIWALGIILFECAEGPIPTLSELEQELMINEDTFVLNAGYSKSFISFLSHCLEKDPELRWTADELLKHPFLSDGVNEKVMFGSKPSTHKLLQPLLQLLKSYNSEFKYHEDETCVKNIADYCGMSCASVRRQLSHMYSSSYRG
jgi:tRNA A-37 threonylcarbamoyl transferase component Bud32